jgi:hypothetical protein
MSTQEQRSRLGQKKQGKKLENVVVLSKLGTFEQWSCMEYESAEDDG